MKKHTLFGEEALRLTEQKLGKSTFLRHAREIAGSHQEKWDGSGYPRGLKGDEIPVSGRLMALADVYDALISKRVYKPPMPHEKAVAIIREGRGTHFDPDVVDAFLALEDTFRNIALTFADCDEEREALGGAEAAGRRLDAAGAAGRGQPHQPGDHAEPAHRPGIHGGGGCRRKGGAPEVRGGAVRPRPDGHRDAGAGRLRLGGRDPAPRARPPAAGSRSWPSPPATSTWTRARPAAPAWTDTCSSPWTPRCWPESSQASSVDPNPLIRFELFGVSPQNRDLGSQLVRERFARNDTGASPWPASRGLTLRGRSSVMERLRCF